MALPAKRGKGRSSIQRIVTKTQHMVASWLNDRYMLARVLDGHYI
jgi:hypothetical protein